MTATPAVRAAAAMTGISEITIDALIERYGVILLDAYGVLVHGSGAMPRAAEFIARLNAIDKPYYVLTNDASKLPATAAARYRGFGLDLEASRIVSSGTLLAPYFAARGLAGRRCAVLGPADSVAYVEQAGGRVVAPEDKPEVVVVCNESGYPFVDTVDAALNAIFSAVDRGDRIDLVLPNPDLIYPSAQGFGIAAGSIAVMLEHALALRYPGRPDLRFTRLGKPHEAIFAEALRRSGTRDMVMIGDQMETDIRGARAFGLDAALIVTGVTTDGGAGASPDIRPTYLLRSLA